uniref:Uncharacterized protein n=1 Tax=Arundo donax TaxID=35708 RepID=A0A0A9EVB0_ARUDO
MYGLIIWYSVDFVLYLFSFFIGHEHNVSYHCCTHISCLDCSIRSEALVLDSYIILFFIRLLL